MGITKTEGFEPALLQHVVVLKALAHPARLAILLLILQSKSCICTDLVKELNLAQSTISKHLAELKTANLIQGSIEQNSYCYCINPTELTKISNFIQNLIPIQNFNCC